LIDQIFVNYSCRVNNFAILKELKKLEKIVADTKRKLERVKQEHEHQQRKLEREERKLEREERKLQRQLERKNQELEQLRSSLTVSAPQQGIDSLPRSLPAQTDGQGTGQPPSNNEISLSME
jgi:predicted RNase H-like nuclease (RuvC/YqgF family)